MAPRLTGIFVAFVVLSALFFVIERAFGGSRGRPFLRRGYFLDAIYWFFTPLVTRGLTRLVVFVPAVLLIAFGIVTAEQLKAGGYRGFGPLSLQPVWLQSIEILVIGDFIGYWTHRLFHGGRWWPFHAVHHSSEDLDWLSSIRVHPVNDFGTKFAQVTPLVMLGLDPTANLKIAVFLTLYAIFLHANVDWAFGPLRHVIATPAFHRWHHSKDPEAVDKNFAGLLPVWDILFGTFYMPNDRAPRNFGINEPMPNHLVGQLIHPFRRRRQSPS